MNKVTVKVFDEAVRRYFAPIAADIRLSISRLKDGVCEIRSSHFAMRIRLGIGHSKGLLITVCPIQDCSDNPDDWDNEIGLPVIAKYYGQEIHLEDVGNAEEHRLQAEYLAPLVRRYCVPYLLEQKSDFRDIRAYVEKLIEESGVRHKKWNFPRNVREEWRLPEE